MKFARQGGVLLHPTSLPGKYGIGTLGSEAFGFVDFLAEAGQKLWQILPLGPAGYGNSPYQCFSSAAGNPLLISVEKLAEMGLLNKFSLTGMEVKEEKSVNYDKVRKSLTPLLEKAFNTFINDAGYNQEFENFCSENSGWLDDFAKYFAIKEDQENKSWSRWNKNIRCRDNDAMNKYCDRLHERIKYHSFVQYIFFRQWQELKTYSNSKGIKIIGDIPLYVAADSADCWADSGIFSFGDNGHPLHVAGVPPDYFSKTGQLWGNPVFNWENIENTGFAWWIERIKTSLKLYDIVRIDHFRGLSAYWSVPYGEKTAVNGRWVDAPGRKLFEALKKEFGEIPVIAEDLGVMTDDVIKLRDDFGFPGMKILQFAFDSKEENNFLPHTYEKNCVVYTGTHDNNTTVGWFENATAADRKYVKKYIGSLEEGIAKALIRLAWASVADIAIVPLQDILSSGEEARMNLPGTSSGNWIWKYSQKDLTEKHAEWLREISGIYGR